MVFPGLVIVTLLTLLAWGIRHVDIQDDLTARARERLDADGHNWATVLVQGRDAILNGTAPTQATKELAIQSLGRVWGLRSIIDESGLIPVASPYKWRLERAPGGVTISGFAPSDPVRDALRRVVEEVFPGALIRDDTALARGAPDDSRRPRLISRGRWRLSGDLRHRGHIGVDFRGSARRRQL